MLSQKYCSWWVHPPFSRCFMFSINNTPLWSTSGYPDYAQPSSLPIKVWFIGILVFFIFLVANRISSFNYLLFWTNNSQYFCYVRSSKLKFHKDHRILLVIDTLSISSWLSGNQEKKRVLMQVQMLLKTPDTTKIQYGVLIPSLTQITYLYLYS